MIQNLYFFFFSSSSSYLYLYFFHYITNSVFIQNALLVFSNFARLVKATSERVTFEIMEEAMYRAEQELTIATRQLHLHV